MSNHRQIMKKELISKNLGKCSSTTSSTAGGSVEDTGIETSITLEKLNSMSLSTKGKRGKGSGQAAEDPIPSTSAAAIAAARRFQHLEQAPEEPIPSTSAAAIAADRRFQQRWKTTSVTTPAPAIPITEIKQEVESPEEKILGNSQHTEKKSTDGRRTAPVRGFKVKPKGTDLFRTRNRKGQFCRTGQKPEAFSSCEIAFQCEHCDAHFEVYKDLHLHKKNDHGITRTMYSISCVDCGSTFYSNRQLVRHRERKHPSSANDGGDQSNPEEKKSGGAKLKNKKRRSLSPLTPPPTPIPIPIGFDGEELDFDKIPDSEKEGWKDLYLKLVKK